MGPSIYKGMWSFGGRVGLDTAGRYWCELTGKVAAGQQSRTMTIVLKTENSVHMGTFLTSEKSVGGEETKVTKQVLSCLDCLVLTQKILKILEPTFQEKDSLMREFQSHSTCVQDMKDIRGLKVQICEWQVSVCRKLFSQCDREVMWVFDEMGGTGKSKLAHVLEACYGFDLFDGITKTNDVAQMFSARPRDILFDVTRSDASLFAYGTLEACKNGFVMSGKYRGIKVRFEPVVLLMLVLLDNVKQLIM